MKKFLYLSGLIFFTGCREKILNFTIDHILKSNEKLNFSINFKNNEVLDRVKESSANIRYLYK